VQQIRQLRHPGQQFPVGEGNRLFFRIPLPQKLQGDAVAELLRRSGQHRISMLNVQALG